MGRGSPCGKYTDMNFSLIVIRGQIKFADIGFGNPFHPYRLPYSALRRVEHAAPLQRLFSPRMVRGIAGVLYAYGQGIIPLPEEWGNICFKRQITARMRTHSLPVQIDVGNLVNSPKMKD